MVTQTRMRAILQGLMLYMGALALIGYFGVNAYIGDHGLEAKRAYKIAIFKLNDELVEVRSEREGWERRIALLRPDKLDPDMLDERARSTLNFVHPSELTLILPKTDK